MSLRNLAERLRRLGYTELFQRLDDRTLDALWSEAGAPAAIKELALDEQADARARFLAAESILSKRPDGFAKDERRQLGWLYAAALRGQFTGSANEWSLPGEPLGRAGEHLLALGDGVVTALTALLDDDTPVIYEGSQEAVVAAGCGFRVKDLAAQFISRITGLSFPASPDAEARDQAIAMLRRRLR